MESWTDYALALPLQVFSGGQHPTPFRMHRPAAHRWEYYILPKTAKTSNGFRPFLPMWNFQGGWTADPEGRHRCGWRTRAAV